MKNLRDTNPYIRRSQRVLLMVHELHKLGFQLIRIAPGMSPSGGSWRCEITHKGNILATHGAMLGTPTLTEAKYSSASSNFYFYWNDAQTDNARQLARKFIDRFPEIISMAKGQDWEYAGWYVQMLGIAERGDLPVAYADWYSEPDPRFLPTTKGFNSGLPMPPGGDAK